MHCIIENEMDPYLHMVLPELCLRCTFPPFSIKQAGPGLGVGDVTSGLRAQLLIICYKVDPLV